MLTAQFSDQGKIFKILFYTSFKKNCEVIIWNDPQKPYVGSLKTSTRHDKKPTEICTLQFIVKNRAIQRKTFTNSCHNVTYKFWTEWSEWSDCPKPCGKGFMFPASFYIKIAE